MIRSRLINMLMAAALFAAGFMLAGCNTIEGVGEDIAATARTVKRAL